MDQATAIKQRAQALIQRGSLKEAMAEYEKLLGIEPINPYAYILLGDLAARMGMRNEAVRRYGQGVGAYESQSLYRNAIAVLKKVQRLDTSQIKNLRRIADLYAKEGLVAESVAHYLDYATKSLQGGGGPEVREVLVTVSQLGSANPEIAVRAADLYVKIGEPDLAARELVRVAEDLEGRGQGERARALRTRAEGLAPGAPRFGTSQGLLVRDRREGVPPDTTGEHPISPLSPMVESEGPISGGFNVMPGLRRAGSLFAPVDHAVPSSPLLDPGDVVGPAEEIVTGGVGGPGESVLPGSEEDENGGRPRRTGDDTVVGSGGPAWGPPSGAPALELPDPGEFLSMPEAGLAPEPAAAAPESAAEPEPAAAFEAAPAFEAAAASEAAAAPEAAATSEVAAPEGGETLQAMAESESAAAHEPAAETPIPGWMGAPAFGGSMEELDTQGLESEVARVFERFRTGVAPQLGTQDHASHYNLGITYMGMGVFAEAVSEFRLAIEGEGYRRRCNEMLATCYSRLGRPDLAADHWRSAIQEAGNQEGEPALRYEYACALEAAGQIDEARKELSELLRRDPSFAAARARLEGLGA